MSEDAAKAAFQKALSLEESGDLAGAAAEFARATGLDGTDPRFWIARGAVLLQLRHFDEAARCLKVGIDLKPHYGEADARLFLADALWGAGRKVEAAAEWMTVSKMTPSYEDQYRRSSHALTQDFIKRSLILFRKSRIFRPLI